MKMVLNTTDRQSGDWKKNHLYDVGVTSLHARFRRQGKFDIFSLKKIWWSPKGKHSLLVLFPAYAIVPVSLCTTSLKICVCASHLLYIGGAGTKI